MFCVVGFSEKLYVEDKLGFFTRAMEKVHDFFFYAVRE